MEKTTQCPTTKAQQHEEIPEFLVPVPLGSVQLPLNQTRVALGDLGLGLLLQQLGACVLQVVLELANARNPPRKIKDEAASCNIEQH